MPRSSTRRWSVRSIAGRCFLVLGLWLPVLGGLVSAQSLPWMATFPANPDHATVADGVNVVASYELLVAQQGGGSPVTFSLGKPAPVSGVIQVDVNTALTGLPPGTYTAVIRAVGPGGQALSPESSPFALNACTGPAGGAGDFTVTHRVTAITPMTVTVEVTVTDCAGVIRTALLSFPPR